MTATREQIMAALMAKLETAGPFVTVSRRNRKPESLAPAETPALIVLNHSEAYHSPSTQQPPIRRMLVTVILYADDGDNENAIPAATMNNLLDGFEAALAPDNAMSPRCTLGGLVQSVVVDGNIREAPGDVTGASIAVIPLNILRP